MICEPIVFTQDNSGAYHLEAGLPLKTVIDVHNLMGRWMRVHHGAVHVELDGRIVVYQHIGTTPEGHWVCRLQVDPAAPEIVDQASQYGEQYAKFRK
jgi:hypothetical protein